MKIAIIITILVLQACTTNTEKRQSSDSIGKTTLAKPFDARSKELSCDLTISPGDSFGWAFIKLSEGELLCLRDGVYNQIMSVPSGIHVRALNDGQAEIDGRGLDAGWKAVLMLSGHDSSVRGLKVHHASKNAHACMIKGNNNRFNIMSCSHGGSYKHAIPLTVSGSNHLIENSWFYGEGRYLLMCYLGNKTTIRGNVFRWDKTKPRESSEPNAAMSNYSCSDMIWENNISLDYGKPQTPMRHCGDICMSTTWKKPNSNVRFLGNIIINHDANTKNNVALRADQKSSDPSTDIIIKDLYTRGAKAAIAVNPKYKNVSIENCTSIGETNRIFLNKKKGKCENNADIKYRYIDGEKTLKPLWPWPNEKLVKNDICQKSERQSDWCNTNQSLTEYVLDDHTRDIRPEH